ncbi:MAG: branched-chain amino acid ABC transporter permease, partial [Candidatus Bathyarchaeia archaeon]
WTGGPLGIFDIPDVRVGELAFRTIGGVAYYYVALGLLTVGATVLYAIVHSRFGLAFRSLRDGEVYSTTLGVDSYRLKIFAFAISAFFMGITGGIIAYFLAAVGPAQFQVITVLNFLVILVWGGLGTFMGPIVGALIFVTLDQFLEIYGAWRFVILGAAVIATILIVPRGIMGKIEDLIASRRGQTTTSVPKILLEKARRKESD